MSGTPKKKTDQSLIDEFLNKGGKVIKGKTKPWNMSLALVITFGTAHLLKMKKITKKLIVFLL